MWPAINDSVREEIRLFLMPLKCMCPFCVNLLNICRLLYYLRRNTFVIIIFVYYWCTCQLTHHNWFGSVLDVKLLLILVSSHHWRVVILIGILSLYLHHMVVLLSIFILIMHCDTCKFSYAKAQMSCGKRSKQK